MAILPNSKTYNGCKGDITVAVFTSRFTVYGFYKLINSQQLNTEEDTQTLSKSTSKYESENYALANDHHATSNWKTQSYFQCFRSIDLDLNSLDLLLH